MLTVSYTLLLLILLSSLLLLIADNAERRCSAALP
jgi:hypothetical protein